MTQVSALLHLSDKARYPTFRHDDFPISHKYGWSEVSDVRTLHYLIENPTAFRIGCTGYVTRAERCSDDAIDVKIRINP